MTKIYDSGDPRHPDLPELDIFDDSSFEEYNFSEDDSSDFSSSSDDDDIGDAEDGSSPDNKRRNVSFFGPSDSSSFSVDSGDISSSILRKVHLKHLDPVKPVAPLVLPSQLHKRKRPRKYHDSQNSSSSARLRANWEPGVTPTTKVSLHSIGSAVTITDYSEKRYRIEHLEIPTLSEDPGWIDPRVSGKVESMKLRLETLMQSRPPWSKVRWINVNGLSWELISKISEYYQLHRLSIEDMIDIPQRTKVDQYAHYTMCILPLVKLIKLKNKTHSGPKADKILEEAILDIDDEDTELADETEKKVHKKKHKGHKCLTELISERETRRVSDWSNEVTSRRKIRLLEVHRPLSHRNLSVGIEQVSLFILNGTVISFFEKSAIDVENAILNRLSTEETILRDSCDASILLQSIIDSIVDLLYPIVTAYRRRLEEMQLDILTDAKISNISELYLMLDELSVLKKSISPVTTLVYALRDHSKRLSSSLSTPSSSDQLRKTNSSLNVRNTPVRPIFISETCELYLSDVLDHTQSFTEDITIMESMVNNLTSMVFNMTASQQNNSMSYLSLVSVIFLPLMFWSSYYGMNFSEFGDLNKSVRYYWKVSISFTVVFIVIVCWRYFIRFVRSWYKIANRYRREFIIYRELRKRRRQHKKKLQERRLHKLVSSKQIPKQNIV